METANWIETKMHDDIFLVNDKGEIGVRINYDGVRAYRILKGHDNGRGYQVLSVRKNGKWTSVANHTIIAQAFHGPRPAGYQCDHINGIKTDNRPENLRYVTPAENTRAAWKNGLMNGKKSFRFTPEMIEQVKQWRSEGIILRVIADRLGCQGKTLDNLIYRMDVKIPKGKKSLDIV